MVQIHTPEAYFSCEKALEDFAQLTKVPEAFLAFSEDSSLIDEAKTSLKRSYDFAKSQETPSKISNALPELIVENFDLEQIWQQIELQNEEVLNNDLEHISRVLSSKNLLFKELETEDSGNGVEEMEENGNGAEGMEENGEETNESENEETNESENEYQSEVSENEESAGKQQQNRRKGKKSVVDDEFFKLDEMEEFLNKQEAELNKTDKSAKSDSDSDSEESVDLFKADSSDEEDDRSKNPRYKDFFGSNADEIKQKSPKRNKFLEEQSEESDDNEEHQLKSSLKLREERLKKKIEDLEEQALSEKPWQLKGEITADKRPQNSLLEEIVDFDLTSRPAPVITEQTTLQLEDVIKQRIKDKVFDSVVRKERPAETPLEYKKKLVLDQEKSKESLAQIYEKEYLKQKEALDPNAAEKEEEEPQLHKEVKTMMNSLFAKLDALSNFHYTPKPVAPELKIVTNLPAISMEEVAPVAASDAALLAPEEVKKKPRGDPIGRAERSDTDKKRERRKKKLKQKIHAEAKKKKEMQGLGNKYTKAKAKKAIEKAVKSKNVDKLEESSGKIKSSTAFFTQLQEQVQSQIKAKRPGGKQNNKHNMDAKKIKL